MVMSRFFGIDFVTGMLLGIVGGMNIIKEYHNTELVIPTITLVYIAGGYIILRIIIEIITMIANKRNS